MNAPPTPHATDIALTLAQQREALWADERVTVYAVVMGSRIPQLPARLHAAAIDDWDRLWTGELDDAELANAPVLLVLPRDAEFSGWLLGQASREFGPWGLVLLSSRPFLATRAHARRLCQAVLPDGDQIRLDWMDPELMRTLLPLAPPEQLQRIFSDVQAMVLIEGTRWTRCSLVMGRLEQRSTLLLAAAT